jgi:CRP-like cAMP-binding protein
MTKEMEWTPLLRKIPFLADFSEEERALLYPYFHLVTLNPGDRLFQQGEMGNGLHVLISGEIQVVREQSGKEHILATLSRRGDLLGEMALLGGEQRPGTATALQPTVMVEMKRMDFERALQQRPSLAIAVARALTRRLMQVVHPPAHVRSTGKIFVLMGALPPKDRLGFALNLALSTLEQTRRRVLLVEVTEDSAEPACFPSQPKNPRDPRPHGPGRFSNG